MPRLRTVLRVVLIGRQRGLRRRFVRRIVRWVSPAPEPEVAPAPSEAPPPTGFVHLTSVDELEEGTIGEFFIGERAVALAKVDGAFFALDNTCPHAGGPLGDGELDDGVVACPWHGWAFDVRTGTCSLDPELAVETLAVQVRDGQVYLRV